MGLGGGDGYPCHLDEILLHPLAIYYKNHNHTMALLLLKLTSHQKICNSNSIKYFV